MSIVISTFRREVLNFYQHHNFYNLHNYVLARQKQRNLQIDRACRCLLKPNMVAV